ncbi:MAG: thioesterase family protein [Pseudomonadota bacterium]
MNLYLRLLLALSRGLLADRLHYRSYLISSFRVWPHDIDAFGHMNNGRYLQIMDVARTDWMARVGVVETMFRNRWTAVIGGGLIRYRHALKPFQRYEVKTRLLSWDQRWWYLEHVFFDQRGRQVAIGVSRAGIRQKHGWLATDAMVEALVPGAVSPAPPSYVTDWLRLEEAMCVHATDEVPKEDPLTLETEPAAVAHDQGDSKDNLSRTLNGRTVA